MLTGKRYLCYSGLVVAGLSLFGTVAAYAGQETEQSLLSMKYSGSTNKTPSSAIRDLRYKSIKEAAETYAAQSGYCAEVYKLRNWLDSRKDIMDKAYDFSSLLLDGGRVLPPVIQEDQGSFKQSNPDEAITARTTWRILREAKIVATPPNWRNYMYLTCSKPLRPNPVLLPKGSHSEVVWQAGVRSGWSMGVREAKDAEKLAMHRLTRDYSGMLRFWLLKERGVIAAPILSTGSVAIRVNGRMLSVNERIFRLTNPAHFKTTNHWKPVIHYNKKG